MGLIQEVLSFEVGSVFQSKSSANIFTLASCSLPLVILVGMFTFPLACGLFIRQWVCSASGIKEVSAGFAHTRTAHMQHAQDDTDEYSIEHFRLVSSYHFWGKWLHLSRW